MTGKDLECYKSSDDLIKNYWSSGFDMPGGKKPPTTEDPEVLKKRVAEYLDMTYYWYVSFATLQ